jgi:hypothetical protein
MIFNLFKKELNFKEHSDILDYLIIEEAEQQWNYHLKEGFTKEAFRSSQFSCGVINLFFQKILKMKIDDKLLLLIADFGFRRAKEIIDEYKQLQKIIKKLSDKNVRDRFLFSEELFNKFSNKVAEMKNYNNLIMLKGIKAINFLDRRINYEIVCQMNRDLQLTVGELKSRFNNNSKLMNEFIQKGSVEFNKLNKIEKNKSVEHYKKEVLSIINTRNKNNLFTTDDV